MKRVCIIGCGAIAKQHASRLRSQTTLAYYSRRVSSAKSMLSRYGGIGVYEHFQDVLDDPTIDALLICSPPEAHEDQVIQGIRAGKSILVEKPMVLSPDALTNIEICAKENPHPFVMVAENYRYKPLLKTLKAIIGEGWIGDVQSIEINKEFSQASKGWKQNVAALFEGGIHFVSLLTSMMDDKTPDNIEATFHKKEHQEVERNSQLRLTYEGNVQATLNYAWDIPDLFFGVFKHSYIHGTRGKVVFESNGLYVRSMKGFFFPKLWDLGGSNAMTQDFLDCLAQPGRKPEYSILEASKDLRILFEAYQKAKEPIYV